MNRVKLVRKFRRMQQKELADLVGVSSAYICDLENNRRGAKPETMERIANALGVTVDDLKEVG